MAIPEGQNSWQCMTMPDSDKKDSDLNDKKVSKRFNFFHKKTKFPVKPRLPIHDI